MSKRNRILLNVDCWELFRGKVPTNREGLRNHVEMLCRGGVTDILLNVNAQKAMYPSDVRERYWDHVEQSPDGRWRIHGMELDGEPTRITACRLLHENVPDAEQCYIDYGRRLGRKVHLSMRMNDLHDVGRRNSASLSAFWLEHPEYQRAPFYDPQHWYSKTLDYAVPAVREHAMQLAREILERFDCDGFELDWMRHPFHFRPGMETDGLGILTEFMREVRGHAEAAAARNDKPVEVSVRVPARPEDARRTGYDVVRWSREKLVDRVIPTSIYPTTDFDMPLELWRMLLAPETRVAAGFEYSAESIANPSGRGRMVVQKEIFLGHVASCLYRGADEIYIYNYFAPTLFGEENWLHMMTHGSRREDAEAQTRRHIVTYCDSQAPGIAPDPILPLRLSWKGQFEEIRVNVGGGTAGRHASVVLGFALGNGESVAPDCEIRLNGGDALAKAELPDQRYPGYVGATMAFRITPGMLHDGDNVIDIGNAAAVLQVVRQTGTLLL
jgi:hypothetical protein